MATLPDALAALTLWGFTYKTNFAWLKLRADPLEPGAFFPIRCRHELVLIGTKGRVLAPAPGTQPPSVVEAQDGWAAFADPMRELMAVGLNVPPASGFRGAADGGWIHFRIADRNPAAGWLYFCNIRCWADALASDVGRMKGKLLIKHDPRDFVQATRA